IFAAQTFESKIAYIEWPVLSGMKSLASALVYIKKPMQNGLIPALNNDWYGYAFFVAQGAPVQAEMAVAKVGPENQVDTLLYPSRTLVPLPSWIPPLALPVQREPEQVNDLTRSQLLRAAIPWVHHWRIPLLSFGKEVLLLAQFNKYYLKWS